MIRAGLITLLPLAACAQQETGDEVRVAPEYSGVRTSLLDGDLVQFVVTMSAAQGASEVSRYAQCAAAQYTLIRGYGFARHLRTNVDEEGGVWTADAVYTISPSLPRGLRTIDAEVVVADCEANGIPTV
jgi:hypothetical protein